MNLIQKSIKLNNITFVANYNSDDFSFSFHPDIPQNSAWESDYVPQFHFHTRVSPFTLLPALKQAFIWRRS